MLYQNFLSVLIVSSLSILGVISTKLLTWRLIKVWFIFFGMLITSMFSKHHDNRVWAALFLMIISAISSGITDHTFNVVGYTWQIINFFLTTSYSLTLRRVMDTTKQVTKSGNLSGF